MGVGPGSPRMSPHEAPAWKLVGGTVGGDGAVFDVLGPVPLSSLAVLCPVHLPTQPGGSRCAGDGLGSALLSARWTPTGLAPVVTLEALSEGRESLTPHWALSGEWGLQPPEWDRAALSTSFPTGPYCGCQRPSGRRLPGMPGEAGGGAGPRKGRGSQGSGGGGGGGAGWESREAEAWPAGPSASFPGQ